MLPIHSISLPPITLSPFFYLLNLATNFSRATILKFSFKPLFLSTAAYEYFCNQSEVQCFSTTRSHSCSSICKKVALVPASYAYMSILYCTNLDISIGLLIRAMQYKNISQTLQVSQSNTNIYQLDINHAYTLYL